MAPSSTQSPTTSPSTDKPKGLGLSRKHGIGWRRGAPTPKQKDYLVLHALTPDYGADVNWPITAGEAGQMIYEHWVAQQAKPPEEK
jgi:hypothetical protein